MPDHLQKLKAVLELIKEGITRKEFIASFKAIVDQILKLEKDMVARHHELMGTVRGELKTDFEATAAVCTALCTRQKEEIEKAIQLVHAAIARIKNGIDGRDGRDGIDGTNPSREELLTTITELLPETTPPETAEQIRDKLESLQDENRLSIAAIHGLEEKLDKLEKKEFVVRGGGGGFSKGHMEGHIIDDETPTGAVNGVNAVFTLANTPAPSSSLKVYVNGQRLRVTDDFTISNRTITLSTAPPSGAVVLADYRI